MRAESSVGPGKVCPGGPAVDVTDITTDTVRAALRSIRYATSLEGDPLLALEAIERRLAASGLSGRAESRAWVLACVLEDVVADRLAQLRALHADRSSLEPAPADELERLHADFARGNPELEAWSVLHLRYFGARRMQMRDAARDLGTTYRTLARRLARGHEAVADALREIETGTAAATPGDRTSQWAPAAASADAHGAGRVAEKGPTNLPTPVSRFIGRAVDVGAVRAAVLTHRLATVVGPGGIGKTRLAIEAARRMQDEFPDGVWFVDLSPITDPDLVAHTVAHTLGIEDPSDRPATQALVDALRGRRLLLVLDNCEHVLGTSAAVVGPLLREGRTTRILATSREPLHLTGELVYRVAPLALPADDNAEGVEFAGEFDAVRLFTERAADVMPGLRLTAENAPHVVRICRRLDGIPLAIELAAARARALTVEQIAALLDDRFRLLRSGDRAAPDRQRTLRRAVEWSYRLLDGEEQQLFDRLSVFAGGTDLDAIAAVCAEDGRAPESPPAEIPLDLVDRVTALVEKSLVLAEREEQGVRRFRQLETLRSYGQERLRRRGGGETLRARHAAYYLAVAERAEAELTGAGQSAALDRLAREHDNLRAALTWAQAAGDAIFGLRLCGALARFWEMRGHLHEGRGWLSVFLAMPLRAPDPVRAKALRGAGSLAEEQGDFDGARAWHEEALAARRELEDELAVAESLSDLGNVANLQGDGRRARELHEQALAIRRVAGDDWGIAVSLNNLGNVAHHAGDNAQARALYEESCELLQALGDRWALAVTLNNLGVIAGEQGDLDAADDFLERSLGIARDLGDRQGEAYALLALGENAVARGRLTDAFDHYRHSLAITSELGDRQGTAELLEAFAGLAEADGDAARAVILYAAAQALRAHGGAPMMEGEQVAREGTLTGLRKALGDAAFEQACRRGRSLTREQAAALATAPRPEGKETRA